MGQDGRFDGAGAGTYPAIEGLKGSLKARLAYLENNQGDGRDEDSADALVTKVGEALVSLLSVDHESFKASDHFQTFAKVLIILDRMFVNDDAGAARKVLEDAVERSIIGNDEARSEELYNYLVADKLQGIADQGIGLEERFCTVSASTGLFYLLQHLVSMGGFKTDDGFRQDCLLALGSLKNFVNYRG